MGSRSGRPALSQERYRQCPEGPPKITNVNSALHGGRSPPSPVESSPRGYVVAPTAVPINQMRKLRPRRQSPTCKATVPGVNQDMPRKTQRHWPSQFSLHIHPFTQAGAQRGCAGVSVLVPRTAPWTPGCLCASSTGAEPSHLPQPVPPPPRPLPKPRLEKGSPRTHPRLCLCPSLPANQPGNPSGASKPGQRQGQRQTHSRPWPALPSATPPALSFSRPGAPGRCGGGVWGSQGAPVPGAWRALGSGGGGGGGAVY